MADNTEGKQAQGGGSKIKLTANPTPPDEIFIDGVAGILARPGLVKMDCCRVVGIDCSDSAEVWRVTHPACYAVHGYSRDGQALPEHGQGGTLGVLG